MRLQAGVIVPFLRRRNCDPGYYHHQVQNKPLLSIFCVLQASLELFQLNFREQILLPASCHTAQKLVWGELDYMYHLSENDDLDFQRLRVLSVVMQRTRMAEGPQKQLISEVPTPQPQEQVRRRRRTGCSLGDAFRGSCWSSDTEIFLDPWGVSSTQGSLNWKIHVESVSMSQTAGFEDRDDKVKDAGSPEPTGGPQAGARTALLEPLLTSDLQNHRQVYGGLTASALWNQYINYQHNFRTLASFHGETSS